MLLAVEGGGFFSSSATGYSKGFTLLLLGNKNKDKPMRVSPWNQYHLVDQDCEPDVQLASTKSRLTRGCASFSCFGCASAGIDTPSHLKEGPAQKQDTAVVPPILDNDKDEAIDINDDTSGRKFSLKSSLKRPSYSAPICDDPGCEVEALRDRSSEFSDHMERRQVQWTDVCGRELTEIREFEPSEVDGSDDEFGSASHRTCGCTIM